MESALKWSRKAIALAEADEEGDPETLGHLQDELKSYEQGKPWRELMTPSKKDPKETEDTPEEGEASLEETE
jgi:hypothetical protein